MKTLTKFRPAGGAWLDGRGRLVRDSLAELAQDFDDLAFLAECGRSRLAALGECGGANGLGRQVDEARRRNEVYVRELGALRASALGVPSPALLRRLTAAKRRCAERIRAEQPVVAGLVTARDWQSPSFAHSLRAAAGRDEGAVTPHVNDYRRDRHLDAEAYERAYVAELVDASAGEARAFLTSCGMAAFTTVLNLLVMEGKAARGVVAGRSLYHETKELLRRSFGERLTEVDERDADAVVATIERRRPGAVFFDSLSNTRECVVPDLPRIARAVVRSAREETYLVVDNTALASTFQPLRLVPDRGSSVRVFTFESLLKYAQFGLDRANAGIVVTRAGADAALLSRYREHLGTNVPDTAVHVLPRPSRERLERRLQRLQRNAELLAARLEAHIQRSRSRVFERVYYAGLPSHPTYAAARALPFRGSCLTIAFTPRYERRRWHELLLAAVIREARAGRLPLLAGSSFGFDTTRVYVTAANADLGRPFVRVAAGTEHRLQTEELADVFVRALVQVEAAAA